MVARCLDYEADNRQHAGGLSFGLGLYNKGGLMGLAKQSRRHYSAAKLFNAAIAQVLSTHTWTTLSVNLDNMTVPHFDRGNAPGGVSKDGHVRYCRDQGKSCVNGRWQPSWQRTSCVSLLVRF